MVDVQTDQVATFLLGPYDLPRYQCFDHPNLDVHF